MSGLRSRIARLSEAGRTAAEIAAELGVACNTVRYHLARLNDERPANPLLLPAPPPDAVSQIRTRASVARLLEEGRSRTEIAQRLCIAKSTVTYHAGRLGHPVDSRAARRYDWSTVQAHYDRGASVRDCMVAFGFSKQSWHAAVKRGGIVPRPAAMPLAQLLVAGTYRGREHVKRRLLAAGLKSSCCECCGLVEWLGKPISLALHHTNGDRHDNRLENLQLLCPNCHSQTYNFAGRNRHRAANVSVSSDEHGRST